MQPFKSWKSYQEFARTVKFDSRYIFDEDIKNFLDTVLMVCQKQTAVLESEKILCRAQLGNDIRPVFDEGGKELYDEDCPFSPSRMKPLKYEVSEGRANPQGIPYLYLATNEKTAMLEVRPWPGSAISLGYFKVLRDLTIVNCSDEFKDSKYYFNEPPPEERERIVWGHISNAFSQPIEKSDKKADYIPTQVIAELIKMNHFDGILYRSSFGTGLNIVLFDLDTVKMLGCRLMTPKKVDFEFDECGAPYSLVD
jgi:hypothetical protein